MRASLAAMLPFCVRWAVRMLVAVWCASCLIATCEAEMGTGSPPRVTLHLPAGAKPIPPGPFEPSWDSLGASFHVPQWIIDAKLGIMVHWGLYSVPAERSEWYSRFMYSHEQVSNWHAARFGRQDQFGYKDFIPKLTGEKFDPAEWMDLFQRAGAKFVVPVAEHKDGFAMYDSALTRWDAKEMGPKRDVIGDLAREARARGLKFGVTYQRMAHWSFMYPQLVGLRHDLFNPAYAEFYGPPQPPDTPESKAFLEEWLLRGQEIIDKYQPDVLLFDNAMVPRRLDPVKVRIAAYYYNRAAEWGREVTLASNVGYDEPAFLKGGLPDYERQGRVPKNVRAEFWMVDDPICESYGYVENATVTPAGTVIRRLVENVCRNGGYLVNISPRADGSIPVEQQQVLLGLGGWLTVNGDAIYGSRPWKVEGEGALKLAQGQSYTGRDIRFTTRDGAVYAIFMAWPGEEAIVTSLGSDSGAKVTSVQLLGVPGNREFTQNGQGLKVKMPGESPSAYAAVIKISGEGL